MIGYVSPDSKKPLKKSANRLITDDNSESYELVNKKIPNFILCKDQRSLTDNALMYEAADSIEKYENFLNWLFRTFKISPQTFRQNTATKLDLRKGDKVCITGCGLGDDIQAVADLVGPKGRVYAQDLSSPMVYEASKRCVLKNVEFSISDAMNLPFADSYFDASYHFGGINLFPDVSLAIKEMARVTKNGGVVLFGDESVAPWLRQTDYGRAMIMNNSLWAAKVPIDELPADADSVELTYVLGNCFYLIKFLVSENLPDVDMFVDHIGPRGGSIYSRYYGQMDGIDPKIRNAVIAEAKKTQRSVYDFVSEALLEKLKNV